MSGAALWPDRRVFAVLLRGAFAGHRGRFALCVVAISVGVALGFAVALVNRAATAAFATSLATLAGDADLEVRGPRAGFSEALFPLLARDVDVAVASPVVEVETRIIGSELPLRILGVDALRAAGVTPALMGTANEPLDWLRPDSLFVSSGAAVALALAPGDRVAVQAGLSRVPLTIAGMITGAAPLRYAVMDIAAAQDAFARVGFLSRIDLRLRPGADAEAVRARWLPRLPAGVTIAPPAAAVTASSRMSRAYRVNLNVLALVALFTGGVLLFATQALAVVRRRAQFALLRTLGLTRRQLIVVLLGEAALLGVAGAALGLLGGYGMAHLVLRWFGADLGAGFYRGVPAQVVVEPWTVALYGALGVVTALAASLLPALESARALPAAALKSGDDLQVLTRIDHSGPALWLLGGGAITVLLPPVDGLPLFGYLTIALWLAGTLALLPRAMALLMARLPRPRAVPAALALDQLRGAPGTAVVSLATIVASVSLMVAMAIMVTSFRSSLDAWLTRVLPAEMYVRAGQGGDAAFFSRDDQLRLIDMTGVRRIEFLRTQSLLFDPAAPRVALLARDLPAADVGETLPLIGEQYTPTAGDPPPVWVSEVMVDLHGHVPGQRIELPLAGRQVAFVVAGAWRDYARPQGALVIDRRVYRDLTGDDSASDIAIWLNADGKVADVRDEIQRRLGATSELSFATPGEIREISLTLFDRTFAVTHALEIAAVIIGLTGLSSSFGALVLARRREFGMLRHLGMTRRQIGAMLACEGALVSGVGLFIGMALGFAISLVLIHVVNRQSFHWGMELALPWWNLGLLAGGLLLLATITAVVSARAALSADVVRAVREDW